MLEYYSNDEHDQYRKRQQRQQEDRSLLASLGITKLGSHMPCSGMLWWLSDPTDDLHDQKQNLAARMANTKVESLNMHRYATTIRDVNK